MWVFGTLNARVITTQIPGTQNNNLIEQWFDMGDWEVVKTSKKPCPKEQKTDNRQLQLENKLIRKGRKLEIEGELRDTEKADSEGTIISREGSYTSRIPRKPKQSNSALDMFGRFFSSNVNLAILSTPTPSTTQRPTTARPTTARPTTSTLSNSNTFLSFPEHESNFMGAVTSDSDYIEIVDYNMDDGTGSCCWFNK